MKLEKKIEVTNCFGDDIKANIVSEDNLRFCWVQYDEDSNSDGYEIFSNKAAYANLWDVIKEEKIYQDVLKKEESISKVNKDYFIDKMVEIDTQHSFGHLMGGKIRRIPFYGLLYFTRMFKDSESYLPIIKLEEAVINEIPGIECVSKVTRKKLLGDSYQNLSLDNLKENSRKLEEKYLSGLFVNSYID